MSGERVTTVIGSVIAIPFAIGAVAAAIYGDPWLIVNIPWIIAICIAWFGPQVAFHLLVGWASFLIENFKAMTFGAEPFVLAVGAAAVGGFASHRVVRRYVPRWSKRQTLAAGLLLLALPAAGLGVTGAMSAIKALWNSPGPLTDADAMFRSSGGRWLGLTMHKAHDELDRFPPGGTFDGDGRGVHGGFAFLTPFLDEEVAPPAYNFEASWDRPANEESVAAIVRDFTLPVWAVPRRTDAGRGVAAFAMNGHVCGSNNGLAVREIRDGTSNTILLGEVGAGFRAWADPRSFRDPLLGLGGRPDGFGSVVSNDGVLLVFTDGSTRTVSLGIDRDVLEALARPDDGRVPDEY